jgi:hypothetical protein
VELGGGVASLVRAAGGAKAATPGTVCKTKGTDYPPSIQPWGSHPDSEEVGNSCCRLRWEVVSRGGGNGPSHSIPPTWPNRGAPASLANGDKGSDEGGKASCG